LSLDYDTPVAAQQARQADIVFFPAAARVWLNFITKHKSTA